MKLDISNLQSTLYFFAPFIIVCYFLLFSIINADLKGIVYLIGLFCSTVLTVFIGNGIVNRNNPVVTTDSLKPHRFCNLITINSIANVSHVPISISIYCFTAFYLLYTMIVTKYAGSNITALVMFALLIVGDSLWLKNNNCFTGGNIFVAGVISSLLGAGWGYIIDQSNDKSIQYFTSNTNTCTMPKKRSFKCNKKTE